jgi:hypothetical protein
VRRNGPPAAAGEPPVEPWSEGAAVIGLTSVDGVGGSEPVAGAENDSLLEPALGWLAPVQAASPRAMTRAAAAPNVERMAVLRQDAPDDDDRQPSCRGL